VLPRPRPRSSGAADATVVRGAAAVSSKPQGQLEGARLGLHVERPPRGVAERKSLHTKRGTPQCSTMSLAQPMITAECRWLEMPGGQTHGLVADRSAGNQTATSAPSSRHGRSSSGASVSTVTRWLRLVGAP